MKARRQRVSADARAIFNLLFWTAILLHSDPSLEGLLTWRAKMPKLRQDVLDSVVATVGIFGVLLPHPELVAKDVQWAIKEKREGNVDAYYDITDRLREEITQLERQQLGARVNT
jgi:hypothetical protein